MKNEDYHAEENNDYTVYIQEQRSLRQQYEEQMDKLIDDIPYNQHMEEQELKALSVLDVFERGLTKSDIKVMADATIENVLNGSNVLQVAEALAGIELFIKEIKDDPRFKNYVREETGKTPKGFISKSGAKIELAEVGSTYDYSQTGDVELEMCDANLRNAEASLKERKEFLKKIPAEGLEVLVPYSGELIRIFPATKTSTSSFKITLAK